MSVVSHSETVGSQVAQNSNFSMMFLYFAFKTDKKVEFLNLNLL